MQRLLLSMILMLFLSSFATGQSLLWKIDGKDLPKSSYVYGTIHAMCPADIVIPESVTQAMDSCDQLALELDLDDPRMLVEMGHVSFMPDDTTLKDVFSEEDYARLSIWMRDSAGITLEPMGNLRPMFLVGLLIGKVISCAPTSYEQLFMAMAQRQGKETIGLETPAEQLSAFSVISLQEQASMVMDLIDNLEQTRIEFRKLADLYLASDLSGLRQMLLNSDIEYGRYNESLLRERNRKWIPRMLGHARTEATFFAVGAGHLPGDDGVLALLREQGYRIAAIK